MSRLSLGKQEPRQTKADNTRLVGWRPHRDSKWFEYKLTFWTTARPSRLISLAFRRLQHVPRNPLQPRRSTSEPRSHGDLLES